jgi:hypothetical protein
MRPMLAQMTYLQWKASRWVLLPFVLLCFGLPQLAVRLATEAATHRGVVGASELIYTLQAWMPVFPLLAAIVGFAAALTAWVWDHNANHVYALSLPLRRSQYALLKLAAGGASLLVPVCAIFVGSLIAIFLNDLPDGLRAYPVAFTVRFLLAAVLAYALGFALAAGTIRTTVLIVAGFLLFLIGGTLLADFIENAMQIEVLTPLDLLYDAFGTWAGPFHVYGGAWTLIDV